ncbi:MAG: succinylglutamate desuccinylase/aspartoacylase family protein [Candidatus Marinimicrobia bacterium]|nr:succinylglutamate desuccinylase/aspartoacylase family protein [Candidatus Neomarinimicrobiota bacterium]MDZ7822357.1 succinylglutamate desuccinylase/aspartoacylase family protein [Candidatus Neomarinimicrobiota bacterium]
MKSVIKKDSGQKGKTLAVFCGVHGNEKAGVYAVNKILNNIEIKKGVVYFVFANPKAIEENKRFIDKNLNRCFTDNQEGKSYEEKRAKDLIKILELSDALLDVHASNSSETIPFVITENGFDVVKNMNFEIIATGFDNLEPGATDEFMKNKGKIGICIECGYSGKSEENTDIAYNSILQFLQYFDAIDHIISNDYPDQKVLHVDTVQKVTSKEFTLTKTFRDFETIEKGFIIAKDETKVYVADKERVILFGTPGRPIGAEAYILGTWKK